MNGQIQVLGCSGGLGSETGSTCIRVGKSVLIDAGTGLSSLRLEAMREIKHVILTHAHMDHIASLPMFLSNMFEDVDHQVQVYALPHTIEKLQNHIFNDEIWPDFTRSMGPCGPVLKLHEIHPGDVLELEGLTFTLFPVDHTIPTVGVSVRGALGIGLSSAGAPEAGAQNPASETWSSCEERAGTDQHFVFTSDTTAGELLNRELNKLGAINVLMIECSFPNEKHELAVHTKHMTPNMVDATLENLKIAPKEVWITHLKPSSETKLRQQLRHHHIL
ncbi:3',5'-cyclic-nucleotide phosphodiesterase [Aliidiomarina halalkaliphila]|uniref:3',5'-cyclic-nucleotide phosphodiesterase n=1 Tax=Aliidiomarina halalkaliphila TaxID=2593535 RepID=A0A552X5I2_9GAMM|nr:3',5'-cyclic-nucleotide phosphodiesterase [Aliidiomarina halalkaliphila]TRW50219.1 3',5'-cyclic-nucleotide phosphodiesterase [Aliidiomarina halalkaliphila]